MAFKKKYPKFGNSQVCVFCNTEENDESIYGKFFHKGDLSVHYNCMFFSSALCQQKSRISSGVLGFKTEDIKKEVLRGRKLRCAYCKDHGATVGCCIGSCRKTFHFPCGKKNGSLHQHFGSFNSYCESHKPVQKYIKTPRDSFRCHICFSSLSKRSLENCLYSTCCKNNWYHVTCLQQYATSAGRHFFKCPKCKNTSDFLGEMEYFGINIPEKDASWELEENAYHDLLYRPECGSSSCKCEEGKNFDGESMWELLFCKLCGSNARHRYCESLGSTVESWTCNECKLLDDKFEINKLKPEVSPKQEKSSDESTINVPYDSKPSCSSSISYADPSLMSISDLRKALRCVVVVTPIKIVTDINGIIKPVLYKDNQFGRSKQAIPFEMFSDNNGMSKSELNKNIEILEGEHVKSESVSDTSERKKSVINIVKENKRCKQTLNLIPNKKVRLQERAINIYNNDLLKKDAVLVCKKSSVKASINVSIIKSHPKKSKPSRKITKCCSNETCISKFFGFKCPKLKNKM